MAKLVTEGLPDQVAETLRAMLPGALRMTLVTGGSSNAELTLTGITTDDVLVNAFFLPKEGGPKDIVEAAVPGIPANGKFKTSTNTSEGKVLVVWLDASNG